MFKKFIKLLIFSILSFSHFSYADEATTYITISNASANEASGKMSFTVTIDELPLSIMSPVRVDYTTLDGTAKAGDDYTAKTSNMFTAVWFTSFSSSTSETIEVDLIDDVDYEGDEYFYTKISTNTNGHAVSGDGTGTGVIGDDDVQPFELDRFYDRGVSETDNNQTMYMVAYFNQDTPAPLTLTYHTQDNSALAGSDYVGVTDTINVPAGVDRVNLPVTIIGDYTPESTKNFKVIIDSISTGTVTDDNATVYIYDNDTIKVDVRCNDAQEGNSGESNNVECRIFLAKEYPAGEADFTVDYTSQDGSSPSATAGNDYTAVSGAVTFTTGDTEHIVNIPTIGDNEIESDENVQLVISGSDYIIDHDSEAEIINDDGSYPSVDFSTADVSIVEGNTSTKTLNFHFELDADAVAGSSFEYYTQDEDAKVSDNDYVEINTTVYNIPENTRAIDIEVTINGDTDIENNETFYLKFKNENKISIKGDTAKGHILNDDGSFPTFSCVNSVESIIEGNSGQKTLTYFFTLDKPIESETSFDYDTWDDDEDDKDADSDDDKNGDGDDDDDNDNDNEDGEGDDRDYAIIPKTHYNIESNETEISIEVTINSDTKIENDELFYLSLYNFTDNLNVDRSCRGIETTIVNDDGNLSEFSIEAPTLVFDEKDSNQTRVDFTIKLDAPAKQDGLSIEYLTVDGTAQEDDFDFDLIVPTTITFDTGEQNKTFSVYINGDTNIEPDESFFVRLQNPHNATLASRPNNQIEITISNDDAHSDEPFTCDNSMYLSSSIKRGTGETGKMWLHKIDTTHNPFAFNVVDDQGETKLYNALAYSDSGDENITKDYIFGLYKKELIKLSRTGKVISLGNIDGLPDILSTKQLFAGAIYDGYYYISGPGQDYDKIFKVKLTDKSVSEISLDKAVSLLDFSFTPDGNYLHGIIDGGELVKIDLTVTPSTVTTIGVAHSGYQFDSTFSDKNGRFFANDSKGNGFFEFNLNTGEKLFLSDSQQASFNDGANCLKEALVFNDYGDAPMRYENTWHTITNGIYLGDKVDHDIGSYDTVDADGDDNNGEDDDDGVTFLDGSDIQGQYFEINTTQQLKVKLSKEAYLKVWIDTNLNGTFDNGNDLVYNSGAKLSAGIHTISFALPDNLTTNTKTYLRARVSSSPSMNPTGFMTDGEVEDYMIYFGSASQGIRGTFNVQRTNSALNAKDFALYTQIVGRDFDYHVVFYDENMTNEEQLVKVPVKIDLIDATKPMNPPLYTNYYYFSHENPKSRILVLDNSDLNSLPATKEALFQITYATDANGAIVQQECGADYKSCFETLIGLSDSNRTDDAQDKFAIRPERFFIQIKDKSNENINSDYPTETLRVASGYEYNLSIIATQFNNHLGAKNYNETTLESFDFNATGLTNCMDESNISQTINFTNGVFSNQSFTHNNVGKYHLTIDSDSNWTAIDRADGDCIENDSSTSSDSLTRSGCNISVKKHGINLEFYPYQFDIALTQKNLPSNTHPDFIYMSELNSDYHETAIQFVGKIIAQTKNATATTNFTSSCMAEDVTLNPTATLKTEDGFIVTSNKILTASNLSNNPREAIKIIRMERFNNEDFNVSNYSSIDYIDNELNITRDRFLDENNGSIDLDLRYNIQKHLTKTINPIQITFNNLIVQSTNAYSEANQSNHYIPKGYKDLNGTVRNFYFTQVAPDLILYPRVNFAEVKTIQTPLNVDIFCNRPKSYCQETNVFDNTILSSSPRKQEGWYLSVNHDANTDGKVSSLTPTPNNATTSTPPISFNLGRDGTVVTTLLNCSAPTVTVVIGSDTALHYNPKGSSPYYKVECIQNANAEWTGIGKTGNLIETKSNTKIGGKMEW